MFSVSIKSDSLGSKVSFQCPKCHTKLVYFIVSPDECDHCGESLPDPDKMGKDKRARYNYHIYNEN